MEQHFVLQKKTFYKWIAINVVPMPEVKFLNNVFSIYSVWICYIITYIGVPNKH